MSPNFYKKLYTPQRVVEAFQRALTEENPLSLVSLGNGEIIFLAYPEIPGFEKLPPVPSGIDPYRKYISDQTIRTEILEAVRHADIIGIPAPLYTGRWPEAEFFFEHYSLQVELVCDAYIGRLLHNEGILYEKLKNKRIVLLGNNALNLVPVLEKHQIELVGHTGVDYFEDIPRVKSFLEQTDFEMAIISAGVPSLILAPWIAKKLGRCALDFGCAVHYLNLDPVSSRNRG